MVTLTDIKSYLRIDDNDNDDLLILLKVSAMAHLRESIDNFDEKYNNSSNSKSPNFVKISDFCAIVMTAELYDKRVGATQSENYNFIVRNMLELLQYYSGKDIESSEENG